MATEQQTNFYIERMRSLFHPMEPIPAGVPERLEPIPDIRAVLFDVYGTLFISGVSDIGVAEPRDEEQPFLEALASVGLSLAPGAEVRLADELRTWIDNEHAHRKRRGVEHPEIEIRHAWLEIFEKLQRQGLLQGPMRPELVAQFAIECECRVNPVWPMPGMQDMLAAMHARAMPLGIVSNAQFLTPLLFKALLHASPEELGFDAALCVWSYKLLGAKPSLRLFQRALIELDGRYGVKPAQVLFIGNDMLRDVWAARRAGCKTALFAGDRRSLRLRADDPRCRNLEPDAILTRWDQLVDVLLPTRPTEKR